MTDLNWRTKVTARDEDNEYTISQSFGHADTYILRIADVQSNKAKERPSTFPTVAEAQAAARAYHALKEAQLQRAARRTVPDTEHAR